ncbi:MAG: SIS domain-containing protein [Acidobacteria bacterium]|nr:SIS domain-containing protein [Acidobacteriota bacterium]
MSQSKMLDEIRQQPAVLARTLEKELPGVAALRRVLSRRKPRLVVLAARGTSDNAAQFGRYLLEVTTGIPVSLAAPSIYTLYDSSVNLTDALLVAISQSGESTDTNVVLESARAKGALTIGITNEPRSTMARLSEHVFLVRAGREKSVAATKTYTGQLLALYLLAHALGAPIDVDDLKRLPGWTNTALRLESEIAERAERYRFMDHAVVVGRGLNYSNVFEFALKLMETCYVVAERFSSADLLHGPIAIVEASFPVFMFAPPGVTWPGLAQMLDRLTNLKAETLLITDRSNQPACREANGDSKIMRVRIPTNLATKSGVADLFTPIPYIVPAQIFAACLAEVKGLDPDRPRTLRKITRTL